MFPSCYHRVTTGYQGLPQPLTRVPSSVSRAQVACQPPFVHSPHLGCEPLHRAQLAQPYAVAQVWPFRQCGRRTEDPVSSWECIMRHSASWHPRQGPRDEHADNRPRVGSVASRKAGDRDGGSQA